MPNRLELQSKLEELLGSKNVYYDPPESIKMSYPAIRYTKSGITKTTADDKMYKLSNRYEVTHISKKPDSKVINALLDLPYCSYDRHYVSNNLHHDTLTIFW